MEQHSSWERFTKRARNILGLAQEESVRLGHTYLGAEHVLLGILREDGGVGGMVLRDLGLELKRARTVIEQLTGGKQEVQPFSKVELDRTTKRLLEYALEEAKRMGQHYVSTEHLLLGMVRPAEGIAIEILRKFGVSAEQVRRQTRRMLRNSPTASEPQQHENPSLSRQRRALRAIINQATETKTLSELDKAAIRRTIEILQSMLGPEG